MNFLLLAQIVVSLMLIGTIQLQSRGTGLGSNFSGAGQSYHSRRGLEKALFKATIGLAVSFIFISLLALI